MGSAHGKSSKYGDCVALDCISRENLTYLAYVGATVGPIDSSCVITLPTTLLYFVKYYFQIKEEVLG